MTPAAYIHARRKAKRISLYGIADATGIPIDSIRAIEAGADLAPWQAEQIGAAIGDDFDVLTDLMAGRPIRLCVVCGCHEHDACVDGDGAACCWVAGDVCSHCADPAVILAFDPAARIYGRAA